MKRIIHLLIIGALFTSCSHRIARTGYQLQKSDYKTCDVAIKKDVSVADTVATKIGEIKLGDTGFSTSCSEKDAIEIFKGEACAMNADLIVITEERRASLGSSCYRGSAALYRYNSRESKELLVSDDAYKPENIEKRVSRDNKRNILIGMGSAAFGLLVGFFFIP